MTAPRPSPNDNLKYLQVGVLHLQVVVLHLINQSAPSLRNGYFRFADLCGIGMLGVVALLVREAEEAIMPALPAPAPACRRAEWSARE